MIQGDVDIPALVQSLIEKAAQMRASDLHIEPENDSCLVKLRIDGMLITHQTLSSTAGRGVVNRLMVLAELLTYRLDIPQEGRAKVEIKNPLQSIDLRIAIMPTTHGLRAAVRMPAELSQLKGLDSLGLNTHANELINSFIRADSGALLIVGPAGSGKTTIAYALLEAIRDRSSGISIVTLEDPVERDLKGVTQIAVQPFGNLTYATALRSMLRQDPQVLMLGEIRDPETASIAMQAALSGHRMICTFHAADAPGAIMRLLDMGIEPYQIASSIFGILSTRLLRRTSPDKQYSGRVPVTEAVRLTDSIRRLIATGATAEIIQAEMQSIPGYQTLKQSAHQLIVAGLTDNNEAKRVLGD